MPATATCGPMKDGESRLSAPVFQTEGGDVEEDMTEEDESEERTTVGEGGMEVRDKITAHLTNSTIEFHSCPFL